MIQYFTIYGERCSGTNFLMHAIQDNFNIKFTAEYAWKHFFGHYDFNNFSEEDNNKTLFIGIIRGPVEWINSFYKKMHHIPIENKLNINTFMFNQFYSVYDDNKEIMEDRNFITKERYKNIFELRKIKNHYLINDMKMKVKNYILIRYEDLRDNYNNILDFIQTKFNLEKKAENYIPIDSYKGNNIRPYLRKPITLRLRNIDKIKNNVDKEQENSLGYLI